MIHYFALSSQNTLCFLFMYFSSSTKRQEQWTKWWKDHTRIPMEADNRRHSPLVIRGLTGRERNQELLGFCSLYFPLNPRPKCHFVLLSSLQGARVLYHYLEGLRSFWYLEPNSRPIRDLVAQFPSDPFETRYSKRGGWAQKAFFLACKFKCNIIDYKDKIRFYIWYNLLFFL